ncbi:hypothetical protein LTS18_007175 [Coniosporium uncinatum]|uniref:Uncharacterized protein n=1 Tax=Coniosporium uncinatum TaxID=93489 RepID=A0ACC3DB40_9PEZI|nr:hypothetical protein LTS18_007175 [Coniosporium uncinatum]
MRRWDTATASDRIRFLFFFAKPLMHEFAHVASFLSSWRRSGLPEPYCDLTDVEPELDRALEVAIFGRVYDLLSVAGEHGKALSFQTWTGWYRQYMREPQANPARELASTLRISLWFRQEYHDLVETTGAYDVINALSVFDFTALPNAGRKLLKDPSFINVLREAARHSTRGKVLASRGEETRPGRGKRAASPAIHEDENAMKKRRVMEPSEKGEITPLESRKVQFRKHRPVFYPNYGDERLAKQIPRKGPMNSGLLDGFAKLTVSDVARVKAVA